jgi:hypothetical protein
LGGANSSRSSAARPRGRSWRTQQPDRQRLVGVVAGFSEISYPRWRVVRWSIAEQRLVVERILGKIFILQNPWADPRRHSPGICGERKSDGTAQRDCASRDASDRRTPVRFASGRLRLATNPIPGDNGEAPLARPGHALAKHMRLAEGHRARQRDSRDRITGLRLATTVRAIPTPSPGQRKGGSISASPAKRPLGCSERCIRNLAARQR